MKNTNLIPTAATVTLPASEYYALIKLAEGLIKERDVQLNGLSIAIESDRVQVNRSNIPPYETDLRERVVDLLVKNDEAMEALVKNDEYRYSPDSSRLSNYSWQGEDLREAYPEFGKAWQAAVIRINNRDAAELVAAEEVVENEDKF